MNNLEMMKNVQMLTAEKKYMADKIVHEGHGQNIGGYIDAQGCDTLQKEHFINYYKGKNKITYSYLRCPQLIIFIAEIVGAKEKWIHDAISILKKYDSNYDKMNENGRNGNYMWGTKEFKEFKQALHFKEICGWIKQYDTVSQVIERICQEEEERELQ